MPFPNAPHILARASLVSGKCPKENANSQGGKSLQIATNDRQMATNLRYHAMHGVSLSNAQFRARLWKIRETIVRKTHIFALAAVLTAGSALPAMAAWNRIGSVSFDHRTNHERQYNRFGGRVAGLSFTAYGNDVRCKHIRVTFANGKTRNIFSGQLRARRTINVDLPGNQRRVERLDFVCRAEGRRDARIDIAADIGQYRSEWQSSPLAAFWGQLFGWQPVPQRHADNRYDRHDRDNNRGRWVRVSRESFEGRRDRETTSTGWKGKSIEAIALKPLNNDARCNRLRVTFANGKRRDLDVSRRQVLRQNGFYSFDLPGNQRNVDKIVLRCHAVRDRQVSIEVYARK